MLLRIDDDLPGKVFRVERLEGEDRGLGIDLPVAARRWRNIGIATFDQEPTNRLPGRALCLGRKSAALPVEVRQESEDERRSRLPQGRPPIEYSRPHVP